MSYCKHEWQSRNEQLRAVFKGIERTTHEFLVCRRCLKIRETEADEGELVKKDDDSDANVA